MLENKKIIVVMPAYRAEKTILKTYNDLPSIVDQVILVDDYSNDKVEIIAKKLGIKIIKHSTNLGYGANQKTCYFEAIKEGADIVIMVHPDYQYTPKLVSAMAGMIASGHYDLVLASRILGNSAIKGKMPWWRYVSNRFLTLFQNILLGTKISEFHTGYRAYSTKMLEKLPIFANSDDFVFDNELITQAIYFDYSVGEISCPTKYTGENSSINFSRSVKYGIGVLITSIKFRLVKLNLIKSCLYNTDSNYKVLKETYCPFCEKNNPSMHEFITTDTHNNRHLYLSCLRCGGLYIKNMPNLEELYTEEYYGFNKEKFSPISEFILNNSKKRRAKLLVSKLTNTKKLKNNILEIGCGNGKFLEILKNYGNFNTEGIEIGDKALNRSKSKNIDKIYSKPLEELKIDKKYNAVCMFHVIEHLLKPKNQLLMIDQVLNIKGLLFISMPNTKSYQYRIFKKDWLHLDPPRHTYLTSDDKLIKYLAAAGYSLIHKNYRCLEYNGIGWEQSLLNKMGFKRDILLELMKGNTKYTSSYTTFKILILKLYSYLMLPVFLLLAYTEESIGRGGTVEMLFQKNR